MASSGNFCTWNPLDPIDSNITLSQGNTRSLCPASGYPETYGNFGMRSGKWYAEFYLDYVQGGSASYFAIGIAQQNAKLYTTTPGLGRTNTIIYLGNNGKTEKDGTVQSYGNTYGQGHIIGIAFDADNGKIYFSKNGTFQNSGNPANGTNPAYTSIDLTDDWFFSFTDSYNGQNGSLIINAGQDSSFGGNKTSGSANASDSNSVGNFFYTPPTDFLALSSANLPISADIDPAQTDDDNPSKLCTAVTFTGNGGTNNITGVGFQSDLAFFKNRGTANSWIVVDSSRGGTGSGTKSLNLNGSGAESTGAYTTWNGFASDGFNLSGGGTGTINQSSASMYGMLWRLNGGTTVSNTSGNINSTTQASDKTGLSIVLYTGNGSQGQTIGHGLTKAPEMVWFKNRSNASVSGIAMDWTVVLASQTGSPFDGRVDTKESLTLNSTVAISSYYGDNTNPYGGVDFTSSVFSVPNNGNAPYWFNANANDYYALCWHSVEGFSNFGFYEGNGNADGPFVYTGFRPRILVIKNIEQSSNWLVYDSARQTFNPNENYLRWNQGVAEGGTSTSFDVDFLSNGFKVRSTETDLNTSGKTFLFMAWGDVPFKYNNTF